MFIRIVRDKLNVPKAHSNSCSKMMMCSAIEIWSEIPLEIKKLIRV